MITGRFVAYHRLSTTKQVTVSSGMRLFCLCTTFLLAAHVARASEIEYSEISGHTIEAEYALRWVDRLESGKIVSGHETSIFYVYLGSNNNIFQRHVYENSTLTPDEEPNDNSVSKLNEILRSSGCGAVCVKAWKWQYSKNLLTQIVTFDQGAKRSIFKLFRLGKGFGCTFSVSEPRENGDKPTIWRSSKGSPYEVLSHIRDIKYCKVVEGNVFSNDQ